MKRLKRVPMSISMGSAIVARLINNKSIKQIVWKQIEKDVSPGEHVGGSGHLSQVDCTIDIVYDPVQVSEGWAITYRYTVIITTEFTVYLDNPPWENTYEKTIVVDLEGEFIKVIGSEIISSNIETIEYHGSDNI